MKCKVWYKISKIVLVIQICHLKFHLALSVAMNYHNNPKCWHRQACINSVDPDQMLQNAALIRVYTLRTR